MLLPIPIPVPNFAFKKKRVQSEDYQKKHKQSLPTGIHFICHLDISRCMAANLLRVGQHASDSRM